MERRVSSLPPSDGSEPADPAALEVDPRAAALLEFATVAAVGEVVIAGRRIQLHAGEVVEVIGDANDTSLSQFLGESQRVSAEWLGNLADVADDRQLEGAIAKDSVLDERDLRSVRRSLWVERLAAALEAAARTGETAPRLGAPPASLRPSRGVRLVPLVLDALARVASDGDAEEVGRRLSHRVRWLPGPHETQARTWSGLADTSGSPAVASVLAKQPAAIARLAALARAGLIALDAPGASIVVPAAVPQHDALPPVPPRRSLIPTARPAALPSRAPSAPPARAPRVRLDPGMAEVTDAPLTRTPLRRIAATGETLEDPLWSAERECSELAERGAPGAERARALRTLAELWRDRLRSPGEAARAYREAAAADPSSAELLCEAAAACLEAGDAALAAQYVDAAIHAAATPGERAAARRLRARLHAIAGRTEPCIEDLCEAAADDPADVESHERIGALLAARGDVQGASRHLRAAAAARAAGRAPARAFALLRWAAELTPDHPEIPENLGALLAGAGSARDALAALGSSRSAVLAATRDVPRAGDRDSAHASLAAWSALLPHDAELARALLACELDVGAPEGIRRAGERLLRALPGREAFALIGGAVDTLISRGATREALALLLAIGRAIGRSGGSLAARALELARQAPGTLSIDALEWAVASLDEPARADALIALADVHKERGDAVAEARALARLVAIAPARTDAFDRLEALLAAAGEQQRLVGLYALAADAAPTPALRDRHLCDLIAASSDTPERAAAYVRELLIERANDLGGAREAAGMLLSLGPPAWVIARAESIAVSCPEALGGKLTLWAVMTAEYVLGDSVLARKVAQRSATRFGNEPSLLLLAERLALDAGDVAGALATYEALLANAIGPHGRRTLLYRAGRWLENAGRAGDALGRYVEAFSIAPSMGVAYRAAERLATAAGDDRALERLYTTLAGATRSPAVRFDLTRRVANLLIDRLGEPERGYTMLTEANQLSETFELDAELRERARQLAQRDPSLGAAVREVLRRHWEERVEGLWEARARIECLRRLAALAAEDFADPAAALGHLERAAQFGHEEEVDDDTRAGLERDLATLRAVVGTAHAHGLTRPSQAGPVPAARASHTQAGVTPPHDVAPAPARASDGAGDALGAPSESTDVLLARIRREPWHVDALRRLHEFHANAAEPLGVVAGQLLAVIDGRPHPARDRDLSAVWRGHALDVVIGPTYPDALGNLLSLLWQRARALPRFRIPLERYGVSPRDRLTRLSTGFVSDAYADAAQALGIHVAVYTTDRDGEAVRALPTSPPCLLSTPALTGSAAERTYRVAHALWLTRGEHAIAAMLDEDDARVLLDAFVAAFGAGKPAANLDRERKDLAAQFWQTIPARDQAALATLVRAHGAQLDYAALRAAALASAARAGLLVAGDAGVAFHAELARAGRASPKAETSWLHDACETAPAVAEVIRCALSPDFLDALGGANERA